MLSTLKQPVWLSLEFSKILLKILIFNPTESQNYYRALNLLTHEFVMILSKTANRELIQSLSKSCKLNIQKPKFY